MSRRRPNHFDLNFDSLTDLITNLAGGFTLLVLLLWGITQQGEDNMAYSPKHTPMPKTASGKRDAGDQSLIPLQKRAIALRAETQGFQRDLDQLEQEIPQLRKELEDLIKLAEPAKK